MGLIVSVYRNAGLGDCTNGGISSKHSKLTLTNVEGPFDPTPEAPAALLVKGYKDSVHIAPENDGNERRWRMFGGNYAATSDSRFDKAIEKINGVSFYGAVPIHDRYEEYQS